MNFDGWSRTRRIVYGVTALLCLTFYIAYSAYRAPNFYEFMIWLGGFISATIYFGVSIPLLRLAFNPLPEITIIEKRKNDENQAEN